MQLALDFIAVSQNRDGGWGYRPRGMSFIEPTAAVLLAIRNESDTSELVARGLDYLAGLQHSDGGWGIASIDGESGWMTAWSVWTLAGKRPAEAARGVDWLLRTEGLHGMDRTTAETLHQVARIDGSLVGWPWQVGDASWVFPTALALLALRAGDHLSDPRVDQGVRYLVNRARPAGGWNFGNPFMFEAALPSTVVDTSLVLMALHGAGREDDVLAQGRTELSMRLAQGGTAAELAWGSWALRTIGTDPSSILERLQALQRGDGSWDSNPLTTAVALMGLA